MLTKTAVRLVLAVLILAALMALSGLDPAAVGETLGELGLRTWCAALAVHLLIYALRAWRFAVLVPVAERPGFGDTLVVSAAHNLAAQVLPAKTGELTLVVYLRARCGVSAASAAASLLVSRLLDVLVLALFGGAAALLVSREHGGLVAVLATGLLAAAVALALALRRAPDLARALERRTRGRGARAERVGAVGARLGEALGAASGRDVLWRALALSVPLWILVFAFWVVLAGDVGLPEHVGAIDSAFAAALASLASLVPLSAFGGIGPMEAGWQVGYSLVGVEADTALAVGLAVHLVQLFNVALFGGLAHLWMAVRPSSGATPRARGVD
ncbi:MAG: lysylphosphatidylglycerol synthase transmembrane domain-containing protein [Planctomycetota bacterium]